MKKKLLFLIFLMSNVYQLAIGEEKSMDDQKFEGYQQIEGVTEIKLEDVLSKQGIDIKDNDGLYILTTGLYIRKGKAKSLDSIKGTIEILKFDQVLRAINFDFIDQSIDIRSSDKDGVLETRVLLIDQGIQAYINLGSNDLKDIVIALKVFVKELNIDSYSYTPNTGIFRLNSADPELRSDLGLSPFGPLNSLNPRRLETILENIP